MLAEISPPLANDSGLNTKYINPPEGVTLLEETALVKELLPFSAFMADPTVTEICVNKPYPAPFFVEHGGGIWKKHTNENVTNSKVENLAKAAANYSKQTISRAAPIMSATLFDGSRMQFVLPPASHMNCSFTMRRPSNIQRAIEDYEKQNIFADVKSIQSSIDPDDLKLKELLKNDRYSEFLIQAVLLKKTIIFGGKTGSGKTTFMKMLCQYIPQIERLITIENARELFLTQENAVHLLYSQGGQGEAKGVTPTSLLQSCMRMRPDRILLAELTGNETADFLQIALSGHPGSITSMHSTTPSAGFDRLSELVRSGTNTNEPHEAIVKRVRQYVDIFVQFNTNSLGERRISHIYMDNL